ncbi:ATP-binding protein, partial [Elusimicrobiota bacterium]
MYPRILAKRLTDSARKYPVVAILGPRQSGKTTLAKAVFPKKPYASLENPDIRALAISDPRRFLGQFKSGAVIDEAQRAPELFSYIQTIVDEKQQNGMFILTGSQHFLLMEKISQSLAGRISLNRLLPLSQEELSGAGISRSSLNETMFTGGYPRIIKGSLNPSDWLSGYIETYLERDVRDIKNVGDLSAFYRFLRMLAHRSGQLLNLSSLANDCGITHNTAKSWLSVLEASFITFPLLPHFQNFNKRFKKSPKVHFYDSGLLCFLLGITNADELTAHSMRGPIFESFIISEILKKRFNAGLRSNLFFWQDKLGREVDCIIDKGQKVYPVEIKSGQTITPEFFKNLNYWNKLSGANPDNAFLVYAGSDSQSRSQGNVLSWKNL